MFETWESWPQWIAFREDMESLWEIFRDEAISLLSQNKGFSPWIEPHLYDGGWDVLALIERGKALRSPADQTSQALRSWMPLVYNAGFSVMRAGSIIKPHQGYTGDVVRYHLGLIVPVEDPHEVGIRVGHEVRGWKAGESMLFDDMQEHETWNRSDKDRVVLLVDLMRPDEKSKKG